MNVETLILQEEFSHSVEKRETKAPADGPSFRDFLQLQHDNPQPTAPSEPASKPAVAENEEPDGGKTVTKEPDHSRPDEGTPADDSLRVVDSGDQEPAASVQHDSGSPNGEEPVESDTETQSKEDSDQPDKGPESAEKAATGRNATSSVPSPAKATTGTTTNISQPENRAQNANEGTTATSLRTASSGQDGAKIAGKTEDAALNVKKAEKSDTPVDSAKPEIIGQTAAEAKSGEVSKRTDQRPRIHEIPRWMTRVQPERLVVDESRMQQDRAQTRMRENGNRMRKDFPAETVDFLREARREILASRGEGVRDLVEKAFSGELRWRFNQDRTQQQEMASVHKQQEVSADVHRQSETAQTAQTRPQPRTASEAQQSERPDSPETRQDATAKSENRGRSGEKSGSEGTGKEAGGKEQSLPDKSIFSGVLRQQETVSARVSRSMPATGGGKLTEAFLEKIREAMTRFETGSRSPGEQWARFELITERFGRLEASLEHTAGTLKVTIHTRDAGMVPKLEQEFQGMRESLREFGYEEVDLHFSSGDTGDRHHSQNLSSRDGKRQPSVEDAVGTERTAGRVRYYGYNTMEVTV